MYYFYNLLKLLYLVSKNGEIKDNVDIDIVSAVEICKKNRVDNVLYYALLQISDNLYGDYKDKLKQICIAAGIKSVYQKETFNQLTKELESNNIDFVSIKGIEIKKIYHKEDMRVMGDIDIVVRKKDFEKSKAIFINRLKFTQLHEDNDELCMVNKKGVVVELHKNLTTESSQNQKYFSENYMCNLCLKSKNYYILNDEFNFIYMMDHIYKHYKSGGIGMKYLIDFFLYTDKHPNIILQTIEKLKKLKLDKITYAFLLIKSKICLINMEEYSNLFNCNISDKSIDSLVSLICNYGEYGSEESRGLVQEMNNMFWRTVIKRMFPNIPMLYGSEKYYFIKIVCYPIILLFHWSKIIFFKIPRILSIIKRHNKLKNTDKSEMEIMYNEI